MTSSNQEFGSRGFAFIPVIGCGCLLVVIIIVILSVMYALGDRANNSPESVERNSGNSNTYSGTRAGQIDSSNTTSDCSELLKNAGNTQQTIYSMINSASQKWEVSAALIAAIARNESNFNPTATSPAGARGIMQIMPGTWSELYNSSDGLPNNAYDSNASIFYGAKYLSQVRSRVGDNVTLIAAGYNAGPAAVKRYGGVPPYAETQGYVSQVTKDYQKYLGCLTVESQPAISSTGSGKTVAQKVLANSRVSLTQAARKDIQDVAYGTKKLSPSMLTAMDNIGQSYSYQVSSITSGNRAPTSDHYWGNAFDINVVNGIPVIDKPEAARQIMARCRELGADQVFGPWNNIDGKHNDHVHCGWAEGRR